jgi:hypothetical protein
MEQSVDEIQLKKLRRRVEHFLRNTNVEMLIRVAMFCGIKVPQNLIKKYMSKS